MCLFYYLFPYFSYYIYEGPRNNLNILLYPQPQWIYIKAMANRSFYLCVAFSGTIHLCNITAERTRLQSCVF